MKNKITNIIVIIFILILGVGLSYALYMFIALNGIYPSGSDAMYYIHKGDILYKSLRDGGGYPLYDRFWYNGIEPMRYLPPLSPFLFAFCEMMTGGVIFEAYIYYCILIFLFGLIGFTVIGFLRKRPALGLIFGLLWFFLPNNLYTLFVEGNLSKALGCVFLPAIIYLLFDFLESDRTISLGLFGIFFFILILCNLEFAGMTLVSICLFLFLFRFYQKKRREIVKVLIIIPLSYLMSGIFLYSYLMGDIASSSSDRITAFFQSLKITLNPVYRLIVSSEAAYFGLSLFIIAILGILASNKMSAPGFLTGFILVMLTSLFAYPMLSLIPGSNILKMLQYMSIALGLILISILFWSKLKKWVLLVFLLMIAVDCLPSFKLIYGNKNNLRPQIRLQKESDETFIAEAKEICDQRIAFFDLSSMGSEGAFLISDFGNKNMSVFGSGWKYSVTHDNTARLNEAMSDEYFLYMFDRCIELGADTVIIQKDQAVHGEKTLVKLDKAAEQLGYDFIDENYDYMLYHLRVGEIYGTTAEYDAIGIGYSAYSLSLAFPNIKETKDNYIDHYTYDYLSTFKTIYLSGFYYENRQIAEDMVLKLSENGVRIVILADGMPEDRETRSKTFLGVTCNVIQFENGYPILYTEDFGEMDCDLFPKGYSKWITYYLNGLNDVKGTISDNDVELAFFGTGKNENLCYIGLNIPLYYYLTLDSNAEKLMKWVMGMDSGVLPDRRIYPLNITYNKDSIVINSDVDYINTGLALHEGFRSEQKLISDNNLLVVGKGETRITFVYPHLSGGIVMSLVGIVLFAVYMLYLERVAVFDRLKTENRKTEALEVSDHTETTDKNEVISEPAVTHEIDTIQEVPAEIEKEADIIYVPESQQVKDLEASKDIVEEPAHEDMQDTQIENGNENFHDIQSEPENENVHDIQPEPENENVHDKQIEQKEESVNNKEIQQEEENKQDAQHEPEVQAGQNAEIFFGNEVMPVSMRSIENLWEFEISLTQGDEFDILKSRERKNTESGTVDK